MSWDKKIVLVKSDRRLFGKVISADGDEFTVEFFRSVADREVATVRKSSIYHAALPLQTRVFLEATPGVWRVGRVQEMYREEGGAFSYAIKFPNDEAVEVHEDACFVRCLDAYADPARILASGCIETQFFADRRRPALRRLRQLRSAAQGLSSILSASIELVPHQIATVRRVTTDRIQRYLLADEVGLGKTIEAGLIIRQLMIDNADLAVIVAVPDTLVSQWKSELATKCLVDSPAVRVLQHSALLQLLPGTKLDLLVVDEAHRLIARDQDRADTAVFSQLRQVALRVPKLLLLSATPALGDERRLHALLNLLDPAGYPLDRLDSFQKRVKERQEIGRLLLTMQPGASPFVLRHQSRQAQQMFPDDPVVAEDAGRLLAGIEDPRERDAVTASLKDHIANTYRIHQRLIRARRQDVGWAVRPRGPAWPAMPHVRLMFGQTAHVDLALEMLEAWRDAAVRAATLDETRTDHLAARWKEFVAGAWSGGTAFHGLLKESTELFDGERDRLEELLVVAGRWAVEDDRYTTVANAVREWQKDLGRDVQGRFRKIVCFASNNSDAKRLYEQLQLTIGRSNVASLIGLGAETASAVTSFAAAAHIGVAVCDVDTEEGVNLQFAHGIVHMDLPVNAARLEQRIGRLDRFGRRLDRIEHRVFLPGDAESAPWNSWFSLLANGFRVFNESISDVQFQLDEIESLIAVQLFSTGATALEGLTEQVSIRLVDERRRLEEQHALDGLAQLLDAGQDILEVVETAEEDEEQVAKDIEPWIRQVLGIGLEQNQDASVKYLEFSWNRGTLLPDVPWRVAMESSLHGRWTWRRRDALQQRGRSPNLLRPGSGIVDVLERIALWDDRGISYATLRVEPGWHGIWRGFRLVWVLEPDVERVGPVYARSDHSELGRRADGLLAPMTVELLMDDSPSEVTDESLLQILQRPYRQNSGNDGRVDVNLGSRPELMDQIISRRDFVALIDEVALRSRAAVLQTDRVARHLETARAACEREITRSTRTMRVRAELAEVHSGLVERPLPIELQDLVALRRAIENPRMRLDEIGFLVLAGAPIH